MPTCIKCGQQIDSAFCPHCGTSQYPQPQPQQPYMGNPYMQQTPAPYPPAVYDSGSFGWAVLGFFFPIVGLVLYLVWRSTKPRCAHRAGMGALVSVILNIVCSVVTACAGFMLW